MTCIPLEFVRAEARPEAGDGARLCVEA